MPAAAREALARLSERYGLVGCVSGRRRWRRGAWSGSTSSPDPRPGLDLLLPGEEEPRPDPSLDGREHEASEFLAGLDATLAAIGLRREDKGAIQALHWRGAEDEGAARAGANEIAIAAGKAGLNPHWGRKVLELRPVGGGGKDAAISALLAGEGLDRAVYAGDDRTDLDAFRRLEQLRESGDLMAAVRVGIVTPEGPAELAEESDLAVDGPEGWLAILEWLAA